jgi:hypothetical protein
MSLKNSVETIGNRTHNLPACSAVPQPTAPRGNIKYRTSFKQKRWESIALILFVAKFDFVQ